MPGIDCVLLMRPTKSRNLFAQMIGRGMRKSAGKSDCLILDVVGNAHNELVCTPTLLGLEEQNIASNEATVVDGTRHRYDTTRATVHALSLIHI